MPLNNFEISSYLVISSFWLFSKEKLSFGVGIINNSKRPKICSTE
jgi:hypothetical protein